MANEIRSIEPGLVPAGEASPFQPGFTILWDAIKDKVPEAPTDGQAYVRQGQAWAVAAIGGGGGGGGIPEAPVDGKRYERQNAGWAETVPVPASVPEAPTDGKAYSRKNSTWQEATTGGSWNDLSDKPTVFPSDPLLGGGIKFRFTTTPKLALLGSSTPQRHHTYNASQLFKANRGWLSVAQMFDPRFIFDTRINTANSRNFDGANMGVDGTLFTDAVLNIPVAKSKGFDAIVMSAGSNDLLTESVEKHMADVRTAVNTAHDLGIPLFLVGIAPRISMTAGDPAYKRFRRIYDLYQDFTISNPYVPLIEPRKYIAQLNTALHTPVANTMHSDNIHLNSLGGYLAGKAFEEVFERYFPEGTYTDRSETGNLLPVGGLMIATGGQVDSTKGVTGTVPSGVRAYRNTGTTATAVCSIVSNGAYPPEGNAIRVVHTGGSAGDNICFQFTGPSGSENQSFFVDPSYRGQYWRCTLEVWIESGAEFIRNLSLIGSSRSTLTGTPLYASWVARNQSSGGDAELNNAAMFDASANGRTLYLQTDPVLITPTTSYFHMSLRPEVVGGNATYEISRPKILVTPAPLF
jgi:hypothetical protein